MVSFYKIVIRSVAKLECYYFSYCNTMYIYTMCANYR